MKNKTWKKIIENLFKVKSNKKCGWNDGINIPCKKQCIDCKLKYGKDDE
jgi:hypothetical protein